MQICDDGHQEICFEGRACPLCQTISEKNDEIDSLKGDIKSLEDDITDLESEKGEDK